jgi:hypothetical protein
VGGEPLSDQVRAIAARREARRVTLEDRQNGGVAFARSGMMLCV